MANQISFSAPTEIMKSSGLFYTLVPQQRKSIRLGEFQKFLFSLIVRGKSFLIFARKLKNLGILLRNDIKTVHIEKNIRVSKKL
jgi:hypothetical protein